MKAHYFLYVVPIVPASIVVAIWLSSYTEPYRIQSHGFSLELIATIVVFAAVAAAAVIEIIKRVTPIRGSFQLAAISEWLGDPATQQVQRQLAARVDGVPVKRRRLAPFDVPIEQLSARIGYVISDVATSPVKAPLLALRLLVGEDVPRASLLERLFALRAGEQVLSNRDLDDDERRYFISTLTEEWNENSGDFEMAAQAKLDGFQLEATRRWRRYVSWLSIAISALVGATVSYSLLANSLSLMLAVGLCATIGAFLSWLVRDITAGVERWRTRV
ncbi:hypothetical protein [Microbacterium sp. NPDC097977]|uniref:hypothetical protein n=1 Tax=Microbacterium sp. NPDC097977 TaxID=3155686 RepID=UPI00333427D1